MVVICLGKVCFCLRKVQDLRQAKDVMRDLEFEMICTMIYEGRYFPADVPPAMDNMFYERFGMSCVDFINAITTHRVARLH